MSGFLGMDPTAMRGIAQRLRAQADHLDGSVTGVQRTVDDAISHWDGDDAHSFNSWWTTHYRPGIMAAQQSLVEMAGALERQIAEQEKASGVTGGGGGHGAGHGVAPAAVTPALLLDFAAAAYGTDDPGHGWRDLSPSELKKLGLSPRDFHLANGMDARLVTDGHGHYVLAYAGTIDATDWAHNGLSAYSSAGIANRSGQVESSVDLAKRISSQVGADHLTLTGHSLGGRDAAVASLATGAHAVTFNAAGATDEDILYAQEVAGHHENLAEFALSKATFGLSNQFLVNQSNIVNYETSDDILSNLQQVVPGVSAVARDPLGHTVVVQDHAVLDAAVQHIGRSNPASPLDALSSLAAGHDLKNFENKDLPPTQ